LNLVKKIQENIFRHRLFDRGAKIVVGCSGGPDSVCLLDVLCRLKKKYDLELVVAHVNYGLRGKDSGKDEQFVKKLAEKYNLPIKIKNAPCSMLHVPCPEDTLRIIRYNFFEAVCKKYKMDLIAVGHNLNDQAETVLMRILRGTGLRGLGAIKFSAIALSAPTPPPLRGTSPRAGEENKLKIIRPLLNVPRKDILDYLRKNNVPYRIDKTNLALDFTRNKIRNRLLGHLEKNFNPNIQDILYKLSQSVADDYDFISRFSREWLAKNKTLNVSKINGLHPAVQREVLRLAIEKRAPGLREIESAHIEEILKILKSGKNKRQKIKLKGLKIGRVGDTLIIRKSNV
jgi:tRNA(Ile)-lysidine synthase